MSAASRYGYAPLFVPGDRPDRFPRAAASAADGIIIDLEDSVAPAAKNQARRAIAEATLPRELPVYLRINPRHTPWYRDDLALAAALPLAGIMLPKTESAQDVLAMREDTGMEHPVLALVESASGIANARAIAAAAGVTRLAFGLVDYCADVGCAKLREALLMPRSELVFASRLAGLAPPLDGVTINLNDDLACQDEARYAAQLGFGGKLCIHPRQVPLVFAGFTPTAEELAWAQRILEQERDGAAAQVQGEFIDTAVVRRARAIVERHRQLTATAAKDIQG